VISPGKAHFISSRALFVETTIWNKTNSLLYTPKPQVIPSCLQSYFLNLSQLLLLSPLISTPTRPILNILLSLNTNLNLLRLAIQTLRLEHIQVYRVHKRDYKPNWRNKERMLGIATQSIRNTSEYKREQSSSTNGRNDETSSTFAVSSEPAKGEGKDK
jgi:hypothetical protein